VQKDIVPLDHTQTHHNQSDSSVREIGKSQTDPYLTRHNIHKVPTPPAGFEPAFPESERPLAYAPDHAPTRIDLLLIMKFGMGGIKSRSRISYIVTRHYFSPSLLYVELLRYLQV